MKDDSFYHIFEDRYRGSRQLIKGRLNVYLPFVNPLRNIYDECPILDLGCGRGEWLELTGEVGFKAHGVDLDEGMLTDCRERGLSVENQDAVVALKQIPDHSLVIVSGFHIAEHLHFVALQELVKEALRVLMPAGLLILETPNPENIIVGTSSFYLDPTHQRPLPPLLLSFLTEQTGFSRTKILRLNESPELVGANAIDLLNVINGTSPDYAVVAQAGAASELLEMFNVPFEKEYGMTLDTLASRYHAEIQTRFSKIEGLIQQAESRAIVAESRAIVAEAHIEPMQNSRSWRITAPLRWTVAVLRRLKPNKLKGRIKTLLRHTARYVIAQPRIKNVIVEFLDRYPTLKSCLVRILISGTTPQITTTQVPTNLAHLTPHARQIYANLKTSFERHKKGRG